MREPVGGQGLWSSAKPDHQNPDGLSFALDQSSWPSSCLLSHNAALGGSSCIQMSDMHRCSGTVMAVPTSHLSLAELILMVQGGLITCHTAQLL